MHFGKHSARLAAAKRYVVIILAFAIIGIVTLLVSRAASSTTSLHANSGAKQGNVASLGTTAVQFGRSGTCEATLPCFAPLFACRLEIGRAHV